MAKSKASKTKPKWFGRSIRDLKPRGIRITIYCPTRGIIAEIEDRTITRYWRYQQTFAWLIEYYSDPRLRWFVTDAGYPPQHLPKDTSRLE